MLTGLRGDYEQLKEEAAHPTLTMKQNQLQNTKAQHIGSSSNQFIISTPGARLN